MVHAEAGFRLGNSEAKKPEATREFMAFWLLNLEIREFVAKLFATRGFIRCLVSHLRHLRFKWIGALDAGRLARRLVRRLAFPHGLVRRFWNTNPRPIGQIFWGTDPSNRFGYPVK